MLVAINGVRIDPDEAKLSIFDRGFLFGDAVYDVIGTRGKALLHMAAHLDRLERSGAAIGLDVKALRPELERTMSELLAASPEDCDFYVRIMITRGPSPDLDLHGGEGPPLRIVIVKPLDPMAKHMFFDGIRLLAVRPEEVVGRIAPWVKSNNRQANVMAHRHARAQGHDDALFVNPDGNVTEGPTWNVFCVKDGVVTTPPLTGGLLPGITRGLVLGLCGDNGISSREAEISLDEARAVDEMFITSTTRGVVPVRELDGERISADVPGPVTERLRSLLQALDAADE